MSCPACGQMAGADAFLDAETGGLGTTRQLMEGKNMAGGARKTPWYEQGLAFECQGCGDCCRGPGGYVWVTEEEARAIAGELGMEFAKFAATMLRSTLSGLALVDDSRGDCPLLGEDGLCRVYAQRPLQCRTWPWWSENLSDPGAWARAASSCPGMNRGPVHSALQIDCEKAKDF